MQVDPTEEQVLLALWGLLSSSGMMEGRDKRQIKCSPELKSLFGMEAMSLSTLRQKVAEHLTPAKAIQVEYNVTNVSSVTSTRYIVFSEHHQRMPCRLPNGRLQQSLYTRYCILCSFGPNAVSKGGGKAFDIEVDVKDSFAFELLESVNEISRSQRDVLETISTVSSPVQPASA